MRRVRGFTLLEVMIVLAMGTILTTIGLVSIGNAIQQARFNSERARLYMDIKEQRDLANAKMLGVWIEEVNTATDSQISFTQVASCSPLVPIAGPPVVVVDYPMINHAGDRSICFMPPGTSGADSVQQLPGDVPTASPFLNFLQAGGGGGAGQIDLANDGRLMDSWGEFPPEGAAEAGSCELDQSATCGTGP